ncbi:MAG: ABC-2 type transport system permease protein [Candidatus Azotimanducaceae bacterium]|jgi:ABC-2 type transport system permease protein
MFGQVFSFELRYHLKSRLFMFSALIFLLMTYLAMVSPNVQLGSLGGANFNSPFAIGQSHLIMSILAILVGTAFLNSAALRDEEFRMAEIVYSTRITKPAYVLGRFWGAFGVTFLAYLATSVGFAVASVMPWLDQELIGPFVLSHYVYAAVVIGLPALFANLAIVYAVAVLSRDQRIAYAAIIGLLVLYQVTSSILGQMEYRTLASLVDPTGGNAMAETVQYWTVFERNTELVPVTGTLLLNRLIWIGIGCLMLALTTQRFRFLVSRAAGKVSKVTKKGLQELTVKPTVKADGFPRQQATFNGNTSWHQFLARLRFEVRGVVRSVFFWVLVALAAANSIGSFVGLSAVFGTSVYPVTRVLMGLMGGTVTLSLMIVMVFYGAELVWRDREVRFQDLLGSTPTPNWVYVLSKMFAAILVVLIFLLISVLVAVLFQLFSGYTRLEPLLYLQGFIYSYGTLFFLSAVLSVVLQILSPNKYFGMLFMVMYILALLVLPSAGWEDPLYIFGGSSNAPYSDMNGYDGQLGYAAWYDLYWLCFTVLIGVLGYLAWDRGPLEKLRVRLRNLGTNANRATGLITIVAGAGFISLGGWIYYNTHVVNNYFSADDLRTFSADYEREYIHLKDQPQPRITDIYIDVDLYPERRGFTAQGRYTVENKTDSAISTMSVGFFPQVDISELALTGATLSSSDEKFNVHQFTFDQLLEPGQRRDLTFLSERFHKGFKHRGNIPPLLRGGGVFGNGTFINNNALGPYIGFAEGTLLTDRSDRRREDLEPIPRYPDLDDETEWGNSYLSQDADWVSFEAVVTTLPDQTAIAPGYLIGEQLKDGRRSFHYKMDAPMQNLYAILSARYVEKTEQYNGTTLSIFYHPDHYWNVDRMLDSLKKSLSYFSENFSPYQYRQMRVLEFPAYSNFAQSFPNTVPWSEGLGFIADVSDPEDIDYVFYVAAHEVAHQWWGHQVSSAKVQGQTTLVETLAQYSALMVMEHEYGAHMMRKFLKYELDRYLAGRGGEAIEEMPLYRVENQQYIHYRKGSVVMYALKDYLGEEAINRALSRLVEQAAYRYDPYPTSRDLLKNLRQEATTPAQQALITDLFEKITIWDLKMDDAEVTEREDGRFDVALTLQALKFEADGEGAQAEVPLDMPIDIGIFSSNPDKVFKGDEHVLLLEKHRIQSGTNKLSFIVDEAPSHAGIDPYNKLIDRNSDDNIDGIGD